MTKSPKKKSQFVVSKSEIILASTSAARRKILQDLQIPFTAIAPFCDEEKIKKSLKKKLTSKQLALCLAKEKALSVSNKFPQSYVIGSDQVCEFEGEEISKSQNQNQAIAQLKKLNGKTHRQNNATVLAKNGKIIFSNVSCAHLTMRCLSSAEIKNYVLADQSWNCAGSYKFESLAKHLFAKIKGSDYSIIGFAIEELLNFLYQEKILSIKT